LNFTQLSASECSKWLINLPFDPPRRLSKETKESWNFFILCCKNIQHWHFLCGRKIQHLPIESLSSKNPSKSNNFITFQTKLSRFYNISQTSVAGNSAKNTLYLVSDYYSSYFCKEPVIVILKDFICIHNKQRKIKKFSFFHIYKVNLIDYHNAGYFLFSIYLWYKFCPLIKGHLERLI
jgi:hypothetical protein